MSIEEAFFLIHRMVEKEAKESGEKDWKKLILYAVIIIAVVLAVFFLGFIAGWFGRGSSTESNTNSFINEADLLFSILFSPTGL